MMERFGRRTDELKSVVRKIAIDFTTGTLVERLPPRETWGMVGLRVTLVGEFLRELRECLGIIKPEDEA